MATTAPRTNRLGLTLADYQGGASTLCAGCGHDAITTQLIRACWELAWPPHLVAKLSGIGCSSKTPAYFLSRAHGFNAVHGRMPAVALGVSLAYRTLKLIGVSGDGDTASIGLGQFGHMLRRDVPVVYLVENNGVYGLTKGQFSATADVGSTLKTGVQNDLPPIDLCALAIQLGCRYVARSFSGDPRQLVPLLQGALAHDGAAMLDVVSPCVTFNNHEGSTKSYLAARERDVSLQTLDFVPWFAPVAAEQVPGEVVTVALPDGSHLSLRALEPGFDVADAAGALVRLLQATQRGELLTGLLHHAPGGLGLPARLGLVEEPLATLDAARVKPGPEVLERIMAGLA